MAYMVVTLDVSKLSDWLNTDAFCRVERRAYEARRGEARCGSGGGGVGGQRARAGRSQLKAGGQGTRGADRKHLAHVRDAVGIPAGYIRVEVLQVIEEPTHIGDGRDVPVGDGAVRRNGGCRVSVERLDRRL